MSNQVSAPTSRPGQSSAEGRLDSWKEIAAYLRREVRTVQRWEKSANLPVHRLQIEKQSAIYAYKSELDAWYKSRRPDLESEIADSEEKETPRWFERLRRPRIVAALAAVIVVLAGGTYFVWRSRWFLAHPTPAKIKLAVLPFKNISPDPEQEYFSDGMTEEMITELGRMQPERLGVIARTSAMLYKDTQKDLGQICRELGVQYVLEGSVFRAGNRARITAQLIQCSDLTHVWADSSERDLVNIVSLQGDVAQAVARNIKLTLTSDAQARPSGARQVNPEAYQDYLKGLYFWNQLTPNSSQTAIKYFQAAIESDPGYALAFAGLANCYIAASFARDVSPREAYSRARSAAGKAVALDDNSAEAHSSLAGVVLHNDWDWSLAEREYRRAIELDPNLALAHLGYGYLLVLLRRHDQAWTELKTAQALDPVSQVVGQIFVISLYDSHRYDEAIALAKQWLELYPDSMGLHDWLGDTYIQTGMEPLAMAEYLKAEELGGSSPSRIAALQNASRTSGFRGFWRKKTALDEEPTSPGFIAYDVASDYAILGDGDNALLWLEKAYNARDWRLIEVAVEPRFDSLRSDPRFQDVLRRLGLPH
jgi:TolB-like protein/Tfp pilus assembly protein PilF